MRIPPEEIAKLEQEHAEKFDKIARKIGLNFLKARVLSWFGAERIIRELKRDKHLNTIPIAEWDKAADATVRGDKVELHRVYPWTHCGMSLSLADRVCALKHVARNYIAKGEES